jgi:VIT1/CCC1 family predicted Fe2+/Mn2+ transporter
MFETVKLLWDFVVLRDAARKGQLGGRVWLLAGGFLFVLFGVAFPMLLFYVNHPAYTFLFVAAIGLVAISMIVFFWLSLTWHFEVNRRAGAIDERAELPK